MPYVRPFPKVARKLLKVTLRVFGSLEENRVQVCMCVRARARACVCVAFLWGCAHVYVWPFSGGVRV
jgi:hypothetical protein